MLSAKKLLPLGVMVGLGGSAAVPPPPPTVTVVPGSGKDAAAFQQDELVCQQHAVAKTGYGNAMQSPTPVWHRRPKRRGSRVAAGCDQPGQPGRRQPRHRQPRRQRLHRRTGAEPPDEVAYMQCMASRGMSWRHFPRWRPTPLIPIPTAMPILRLSLRLSRLLRWILRRLGLGLGRRMVRWPVGRTTAGVEAAGAEAVGADEAWGGRGGFGGGHGGFGGGHGGFGGGGHR